MTIGTLRKMLVEGTTPISYTLPIGQESVALNSLLNAQVTIEFIGNIYCIECGRKTKKSFNQGYCFPCLRNLAQCDLCIVKPELCHYDQGTCRQPEWGESNCMQAHVVYIANSSGLKVGITRAKQIPTRWIDQGAVQALPIFEVDSRLQSGLLEVVLKKYVSDRTEWRTMLKGDPSPLDLIAERHRIFQEAKTDLVECTTRIGRQSVRPMLDKNEVCFRYPIINYPTSITSHNFDKNPLVQGRLQGIKGQYMMLDTGVLNVRKFGGYEVKFSSH